MSSVGVLGARLAARKAAAEGAAHVPPVTQAPAPVSPVADIPKASPVVARSSEQSAAGPVPAEVVGSGPSTGTSPVSAPTGLTTALQPGKDAAARVALGLSPIQSAAAPALHQHAAPWTRPDCTACLQADGTRSGWNPKRNPCAICNNRNEKEGKQTYKGLSDEEIAILKADFFDAPVVKSEVKDAPPVETPLQRIERIRHALENDLTLVDVSLDEVKAVLLEQGESPPDEQEPELVGTGEALSEQIAAAPAPQGALAARLNKKKPAPPAPAPQAKSIEIEGPPPERPPPSAALTAAIGAQPNDPDDDTFGDPDEVPNFPKGETAKRGPGRPPTKGFTLYVNCAPIKGINLRSIVHFEDVMARYQDVMRKEAAEKGLDVDSYFKIDAFKRRDYMMAAGGIIAAELGKAHVIFRGKSTDMLWVLDAIRPFAGRVVEVVGN